MTYANFFIKKKIPAVLGGALLAMGDWLWVIGYWLLDALRAIGRFAMGYWRWDMGYWLLAIGYWLWAIGDWQWGMGYWRWDMGDGLWVIFLQIIFVLFAYVKDLY